MSQCQAFSIFHVIMEPFLIRLCYFEVLLFVHIALYHAFAFLSETLSVFRIPLLTPVLLLSSFKVLSSMFDCA